MTIDITERQTGKTYRLIGDLLGELSTGSNKNIFVVCTNYATAINICEKTSKLLPYGKKSKYEIINPENNNRVLFESCRTYETYSRGLRIDKHYYDEFAFFKNDENLYYCPDGYYCSSPLEGDSIDETRSRLIERFNYNLKCKRDNTSESLMKIRDQMFNPLNKSTLSELEYHNLKLQYMKFYKESIDIPYSETCVKFAEEQLTKYLTEK